MPSRKERLSQTKAVAGPMESSRKAGATEDFEKLGVFYLGRAFDLG
jgi:hypothetical protein